MRNIFAAALLAAGVGAGHGPAAAPDYPTRTLPIGVPVTAGGRT